LRDPITLALDGWTNVRHAKVTNVLLLQKGQAYYWTSIVNHNSRNTADFLFDKIHPILLELIQHGVYIIGIVADNNEVNRKLIRLLQSDFKFLVHIPCSVHTLQLCVRAILQLPTILKIVDKMNEVLKHFERSKDARNDLRSAQELKLNSNATKRIYSLIKPCETRWSSSFIAAKKDYWN
jgi:hypothetical protein